jgi:hypothetical protein
MDVRQLEELKRWFEAYSSSYFGSDDYVNSHLQMKKGHTWRTCEEILHLANEISLDGNETRIAEAVALLHDIGRFPQFVSYQTYNDVKSINHCALGIQVLRQERVLEHLDEAERSWVETAVAHHGQKSLPENLNGQALLFLKLIRDADKLDIFQIVIQRYRCYREDPGGILLELPDEPQVSPEVLDAVLKGDLIDYGSLRTMNDFKLCQIGWVYDMNFPASLEKLKSGKILDEMFNFLPQTPEITEVQSKVRSYIDTRIKIY